MCRSGWPTGAGLRIGTSSPRRAELLPSFFAQALPHAARNKVTLENLRGNVDSRLRRLLEPRGSERQLDGVVLALAGLSRLFADTTTERQGHALLRGILQGLPFMVLPLTESPGAPGQGALAIECRSDDAHTRALLAALEDPPTRARHRVRTPAAGAAWRWLPSALRRNAAMAARTGRPVADRAAAAPADQDIAERRWLPDAVLPAHTSAPCAPGMAALRYARGHDHAAGCRRTGAAPARHRRVHRAFARPARRRRRCTAQGRAVWTSGTKSWFALAAQGVWVQAAPKDWALKPRRDVVAEPVLRLPPPGQWAVLTHAGAEDPWQAGRWAGADVIATYALADAANCPTAAALAAATHVFWHSVRSSSAAAAWPVPTAHHATGPGKTFDHVRRAGVRNCRAFPSVVEWREWTAKAR